MNAFKNLKFENTHRDFTLTLNKRVNDYFKTNGLSRYANAEMVVKSITMFSLYFVPYFLILTGVVSGTLATLFMIVLMGLGLAGIGLTIMHDGNHGAYSNKRWINSIVGYTLNLIGASSFNWKIQHNVLHHSYTNVFETDEDITKKGVLRFTPHAQWSWYHKYQFIYAWFLYGLMTMSWIIVKDIIQLAGYTKDGLLKKQTKSVTRAWIWLIFTKIIYYSYILALPILFTSLPWYHILLGFILMHYVAGFTLGIIFQPAHVMEDHVFEDGDKTDVVEENWAVHQLKTTCNFAQRAKFFSWFVGGLNYQIEHHLFPNVCHVHYRKIAKIVRETAEEYNIPYKSYPTFGSALVSHGRMLYSLGR